MAQSSTSSANLEDTMLFTQYWKKMGISEEISGQNLQQLLREVELGGDGDIPIYNTDNSLHNLLAYMVVHVVGRPEAHMARETIKIAQAINISKKEFKSKLKAPSRVLPSKEPHDHAILLDPFLGATLQQDLACRGFAAMKIAYECEYDRIHELERQKNTLGENISSKGQTLLFLAMLKQREESRLLRLGDLGVMSFIKASRNESERLMRISIKMYKTPLMFELSHSLGNSETTLPRHTREALSKLYTKHLAQERGDKLTEGSDLLKQQDIEKRLKSITQRLGLKSHEQSEILRRVKVLAAHRVANQDGALRGLTRAVLQKTALLQSKLDRAGTLEWMCEKEVGMITVFRAETGPSLRTALKDEAYRVEGYIDLLRRKVTQDVPQYTRAEAFLGTPRTSGKVAEDTRRTSAGISLTQNSLRLFESMSGLGNDKAAQEIQGILDIPSTQTLLERKSKKANHGLIIADDVRALLADIQRMR